MRNENDARYEFRFELKPIGVGYRCPHCEKGEMKVDTSQPVLNSMPPKLSHKCTKCEGTLQLTKQYPYVDWMKGDELNEDDL